MSTLYLSIYLILEPVSSAVVACLLRLFWFCCVSVLTFLLHWSVDLFTISFYPVTWQQRLCILFCFWYLGQLEVHVSMTESQHPWLCLKCISGPAVCQCYSQYVITVSCLWNWITWWWRLCELVCYIKYFPVFSALTNLSFKGDTLDTHSWQYSVVTISLFKQA